MTTFDERRVAVRGAIQRAVKSDEIREQAEIIAAPLSGRRVSEFVTEMYAQRFQAAEFEFILDRLGAFEYLTEDSTEFPARGFRLLAPRGSFVDGSRWMGLHHGFGSDLAADLVVRFRAALAAARSMPRSLATAEEVLSGVDAALTELGEPAAALIVFAGDWHEQTVNLQVRGFPGYVPEWSPTMQTPAWPKVAFYRGHPILHDYRSELASIYVVDCATWGTLVRTQLDGTDLRVEVDSVTEEEAKVLAANELSEEDLASRILSYQAQVKLGVWEATGFSVREPSAAVILSDPSRADSE